MAALTKTVARLCELSERDHDNPYSYLLGWPQKLNREQWFIEPELISLCGLPEFEHLSEAEKKRLSFYEAVNFFSLNVHGEKSLVAGLARRLYGQYAEPISPYLHHFLTEENNHMVYFGEFCMRYAGKVYPAKKLLLPRDYAPGEEDFLFFAQALIFEEIVERHNLKMSLDARLEPTARQINNLHHRDELRHLVFGRQLVKMLFERHAPSWPADTLDEVQEILRNYITITWKEYYNPEVYRDMGFKDPWELQQRAFHSPRSRERRREITAKCLRYLVAHRMLAEERAS